MAAGRRRAVLALALPLAIDLVDVVVEGEVNTLMSHPLQMVIPFALVLAWREAGPLWWQRLVRLGAAAAVALVCWWGTIVAYASYQTRRHGLPLCGHADRRDFGRGCSTTLPTTAICGC